MFRDFRLAAVVALTLTACALSSDPPVHREEIEWLDVWVPGNGNTELPKVLLIGDSIARGYYKEVEDRLKRTAVVARLTTSKSLGDPALLSEVKLVLSQAPFDVVHVNNGLHGWDYTEPEYAAAMPDLIAAIRAGAPRARILWAMTTPVRDVKRLESLADKNDRVRKRNALAAGIMGRHSIPIVDLYAVLADKPELYSRDGVHLTAKGTTAVATRVADAIRPLVLNRK